LPQVDALTFTDALNIDSDYFHGCSFTSKQE